MGKYEATIQELNKVSAELSEDTGREVNEILAEVLSTVRDLIKEGCFQCFNAIEMLPTGFTKHQAMIAVTVTTDKICNNIALEIRKPISEANIKNRKNLA